MGSSYEVGTCYCTVGMVTSWYSNLETYSLAKQPYWKVVRAYNQVPDFPCSHQVALTSLPSDQQGELCAYPFAVGAVSAAHFLGSADSLHTVNPEWPGDLGSYHADWKLAYQVTYPAVRMAFPETCQPVVLDSYLQSTSK